MCLPLDGLEQVSESVIGLHSFGDASPKAYGAAAYIRVTDRLVQVSSQLVMSKSRVAPIKTVSNLKTRTSGQC